MNTLHELKTKNAFNCLKCYPKLCSCDNKGTVHYAVGAPYQHEYKEEIEQWERER